MRTLRVLLHVATAALAGTGGPAAGLAAGFETGAITFAVGAVRLPSGALGFPARPAVEPLRRSPGEVRFQLTADVLFAFDQADLRPEALSLLRELSAQIAKAFPHARVTVEGHTDAMGEDAYNNRLATRRAEAVRGWLVSGGGIAAEDVLAAGFGESRPVAPNVDPDGSDNPEGRQQNRRVEIVVTARG